jgi:hypothetical protein
MPSATQKSPHSGRLRSESSLFFLLQPTSVAVATLNPDTVILTSSILPSVDTPWEGYPIPVTLKKLPAPAHGVAGHASNGAPPIQLPPQTESPRDAVVRFHESLIRFSSLQIWGKHVEPSVMASKDVAKAF